MKKLNKILILILSIFVITSCQKQDDILKIDVDVVDNEVFAFDEDGLAEANGQLTDSNFASAESARSACPVAVIDIVEN